MKKASITIKKFEVPKTLEASLPNRSKHPYRTTGKVVFLAPLMHQNDYTYSTEKLSTGKNSE